MQAFVDETNAFASDMKVRYWRELTVAEFKTFLAIILYLGIVKYPSRGLAWSLFRFYGSNFVKSMISKFRFETVLRCWHFMNTAKMTEVERKAAKKKDAFYSVTPFLELLSKNFNKYYQAGQGLDIDESCIDFKDGQ